MTDKLRRDPNGKSPWDRPNGPGSGEANGPGGRPALDVVCFSHLRWDFVYQRPQHILTRFAADRRVFVFEEPMFDADEARLDVRKANDNVFVVVPHLAPATSAEDAAAIQSDLTETFLAENGVDRYILWFYTPMAVEITRRLTPMATVYDCMDELSAFTGAPRTLLDREGELLDSADLVFTGGASLHRAKERRHPHVHLFPSSVDRGHFARARRPQPEPADQAGIPAPRVGFYGVIDERLDTYLLAEIARLRPAWHFVMIGPVVKIDPAVLPSAANIHYLGQKGYAELPEYVSSWDVAILPFARNEATRYISPTKTPEYLAAGLPVVSTPISDVERPYGERGLVRIADSPTEFVAQIEAAMHEDRETRLANADAFLAEASWDRTFEDMKRLIDRAVAERERRSFERADVVVIDEAVRRPRGGVSVERRDFDYLIVGAGFAGSVLAERLASQTGARVLIVERRNHVGGNAYDRYDEHGILIHPYGPHIFHTNSREVFDYLSQFTAWRPYEHRVMASVDGQLVPMPINLDTINQLYGLNLNSFEVEQFFAERREPIEHPRTSEDVVVSQVGRELYEKFFRGYTRKQWDLDPSELDASVISRVPIRTNRDDRYFTDTYQAMPLHGYSRMFERMLDHPNIKVMLNTDYREVEAMVPHRELIYTGPVDEYFGFRFGRLPYRSLEFRVETHETERLQPVAVINFPNEHAYTRVTEFKHLTGQVHPRTSVVYEYPRAEGDPYYPVPRPDNGALYKRYKALAEATPGVHFVGRLATYKYYNMDQVAAQALAVFRRLASPAPVGNGSDVLGATVSSARGTRVATGGGAERGRWSR